MAMKQWMSGCGVGCLLIVVATVRQQSLATGGGALLAVGTEKDGTGFHFEIE